MSKWIELNDFERSLLLTWQERFDNGGVQERFDLCDQLSTALVRRTDDLDLWEANDMVWGVVYDNPA